MKHPTKSMIGKVCLALLAAFVFTGGQYIGTIQEDEILLANTVDSFESEQYPPGDCGTIVGWCSIRPKSLLDSEGF